MSSLYDKGRESFLKGEIAMQTDTIKIVLVDTGAYTVDLAAHDFLDDIPAGARIATSGALQNPLTAAGVFDADNITLSSVSGASIEALVVYKDTGSASSSNLIAYIDSGTGLPVTPNGGDITISWDNLGNKIFKL
tara:strand:+ start:3922 stop:4326 length:405 start_codon:yes stop_codon:yes gene_type:complete